MGLFPKKTDSRHKGPKGEYKVCSRGKFLGGRRVWIEDNSGKIRSLHGENKEAAEEKARRLAGK